MKKLRQNIKHKKKQKHYLEDFAGFLIQKLSLADYFNQQVKEDIQMLYPPTHCKEECFRYYQKKLAKTFLVFLVGMFVIILLTISEMTASKILYNEEGSFVQRDKVGGKMQEIPVSIETKQQRQQLNLTVSPQSYKLEEFQQVCQTISEALPREILLENESLSKVSTKLNLMERYKDYPISITWSCSDYTYLNADGSVHTEQLKEGETLPVELTAVLEYEDFQWEEHFSILLMPPERNAQEAIIERLQDFLTQQDLQQQETDRFWLPGEFEGSSLFIAEVKSHKGGLCFLGLLMTLVLIFQLQNQDLHKETEEKRQRLLLGYPEFVSKLMLFMGAGMSTKSAMKRLVQNYETNLLQYPKEKNDVYEELKLAVYAMDNGVFEKDALDAFGKRTKVNQYCKLMALLIQNSQKGTKDILQLLEAEAEAAFELRKQQAKRLGEQAGTKLLLPMLMMLGIVMVLIIVPAFLSYQI